MKASFDVRYSSLPDGGAEVRVFAPGTAITLPLDRKQALIVAASILGHAGVGEASFRNGRLHVLDGAVTGSES